ncbi:MAG: glycosyltransferase family 2 protein [Cyanobacteria bacterium CRU_2_1]|nr:glycosyltransferase family 2 protein [Cyanobacteria bacterium RU_5_0]NJR58301.1 glycosyltransferase family 2 protein [Cyanobacteria bacterium CRU_2_1]
MLKESGSSLSHSSNVTSADSPRIVLGIYVYNGENYLREAIESVLAQTFTDFRLIISDNASTDSTPDICREYAARDNRIVYYRQPKNIGGAGNWNFVFQLGNAPYFKWLAHDDIIAPDYLRQCMEVFDRNPSLAIVHSRSLVIDDKGDAFGNYDHEVRLNAPCASDRFRRILWAGYFNEVFGVMRSDLVAKTRLQGSFSGADRNFMAEVLLLGDVGYVEDYLFYRRDHPGCFCRAQNDQVSRLLWFDPTVKRTSLAAKVPGFIKWKAYFEAIFRSPIPLSERLACVQALMEWGFRRGIESLTGTHEQFRQKVVDEYALLDGEVGVLQTLERQDYALRRNL